MTAIVLLGGIRVHAATVDEFDDGSTAAWTFNQLTAVSESGGAMRGTQNVGNGDPFFFRAVPNSAAVETDGNAFVHVRLKKPATMSGSAQLFWSDGGPFSGAESTTFATTNDNAFQDYVLDLSGDADWVDGLVRNVRIDPSFGVTTSGQFEIEHLRISSSATKSHELFVDNFSDGSHSEWAKSAGFGSPVEAGGLLSGTATNGDPFMGRDILDVDGSEVTIVRIGLAMTGADTIGQIFWGNEDGGFVAARSANFAVIGDGVMRTYEIDLSADLDWVGKTINELRLDPTNTSGNSFQIDFIEIVSAAVIPEPSTFGLAAFGLLGIAAVRRRRSG